MDKGSTWSQRRGDLLTRIVRINFPRMRKRRLHLSYFRKGTCSMIKRSRVVPLRKAHSADKATLDKVTSEIFNWSQTKVTVALRIRCVSNMKKGRKKEKGRLKHFAFASCFQRCIRT